MLGNFGNANDDKEKNENFEMPVFELPTIELKVQEDGLKLATTGLMGKRSREKIQIFTREESIEIPRDDLKKIK